MFLQFGTFFYYSFALHPLTSNPCLVLFSCTIFVAFWLDFMMLNILPSSCLIWISGEAIWILILSFFIQVYDKDSLCHQTYHKILLSSRWAWSTFVFLLLCTETIMKYPRWYLLVGWVVIFIMVNLMSSIYNHYLYKQQDPSFVPWINLFGGYGNPNISSSYQTQNLLDALDDIETAETIME